MWAGLTSPGTRSPALLRKASRLADRLNAPWYAVYIQTPAEDLSRVDAATQRILGKNLTADPRIPAQTRPNRTALSEPVAERSPAFERLLLGFDRRVELVGHPAFIHAALKQPGSSLRRQPICEPERPGVLGGRLAMRAPASRLLSRLRRPPQHRLAIGHREGGAVESGGVGEQASQIAAELAGGAGDEDTHRGMVS